MSLKIWHWIKHEDAGITRLKGGVHRQEEIKRDGGFWHEGVFVPWHRINYIEFIEDETEEKK